MPFRHGLCGAPVGLPCYLLSKKCNAQVFTVPEMSALLHTYVTKMQCLMHHSCAPIISQTILMRILVDMFLLVIISDLALSIVCFSSTT